MNPRFHRNAFTLLELLVAMAIASLLIVMLASTLTGVSGATQSTGARIETEREARAVFEILERDLTASVRNDPAWIRVIEDPDPPANGEKPHWLFFLAAPRDHDRNAPGDVCLVSYRTGHDPLPGEEEPFPSLHRIVIPASDTYENALGKPSLDESYFAENPSAEQSSRALESWLAAGVIDLQIRCYTEGMARGRAKRLVTRSIDLSTASAPEIARLTEIEVTLVILTKQGRHLFATLPPEVLRQRFAYRFTRRIPIPIAAP